MLLTVFNWNLPIRDPVFLFSILLLMVLVVPALLQRLRMPGMVGLIVAGAILGPHGINLLERGEGIQLLASGGLLYIMFWAGLEINMVTFLKNRHKSLAFGILTFIFPLTLGGLCSYFFLGLDLMGALLLASMFSTHTLISYPIVNRLRVAQNEAVTITVGGTIITDTLALLMLAVISGMAQGTMNGWFWGQLVLSLGAFGFVAFGILPRIARWFFRRVESDLTYQYVFVLATVFLCGLMAELAGVEAIIGAFMAGLVLNRLIPGDSPLMNRIEFVGNAIFIPAFLFSVGMLVNLDVFFQGKNAIIMAVVLTGIALLTKWLAAYATQKIFGYSSAQRSLIFGLSSSHAAATIAIVLIGFQVKIFDEEVLNSTIFLILITCLVSTFVTDRAARKIASMGPATPQLSQKTVQRILVPFANPNTVTNLVDFSILIKTPGQKEPVYPLSVILDDQHVKERILQSQRLMEPVMLHAQTHQTTLAPVNRVDVSSVSGILSASKELLITDIVIGWRPKMSASDKFFGTVLDKLLEDCPEMVFVTHFMHSPFLHKQVKVFIASSGHLEPGFGELVLRIENICQRLHAPLKLYSSAETGQAVRKMISSITAARMEEIYFSDENWWEIHTHQQKDDLLMLVSARRTNISYNALMDNIPYYLAEKFTRHSFVLAFPPL